MAPSASRLHATRRAVKCPELLTAHASWVSLSENRESSVEFLIFVFCLVCVCFQDTVSLCCLVVHCRSGWPQTHRDPHAFASRVLGLKAWATSPQLKSSVVSITVESEKVRASNKTKQNEMKTRQQKQTNRNDLRRKESPWVHWFFM